MNITFTTSEMAKRFGVHPNTIRLYEELNLISRPERKSNGYRIFTPLHMEQMQLARLAFQIEVMQNGLRKQAVAIVKASGRCDFDTALRLTSDYRKQLDLEKQNAEEAIVIAKQMLRDKGDYTQSICLTRQNAADMLHITIDTLRNWELNGLLSVKRKQNGYRIYMEPDIQRLKIIKSLRCANYSLSSILPMLHVLSNDPDADMRSAIDMPQEEAEVITACDQLLTSLAHASSNAQTIFCLLQHMKAEYEINPPLTHQP